MVEITPKDLYQFLLTDCRYGYDRNNHLMPSGAYEHVKQYLPTLAKADAMLALHTAQQLCEECISMELVQFSDGIDDEHGNRAEAFRFIEGLIAYINASELYQEWKPYNYDYYLANKALDDKPRYNIYNYDYFKSEDSKFEAIDSQLVNDHLLSKNEIADFIFNKLLNVGSITYRKFDIKPGYDEYFETKADYNEHILTKYVFDSLKKAYIVKRGDC